MAVLNAQTRAEIRASIGYNLGAMRTGTTTSAGTTTTFTDTELPASDNWANGMSLVMTSGSASGDIRIVDDYNGSSKTGSLRTAASATIGSGDSYELWAEDMPPQRIHDFINRAIRTITRKGSPPIRDISIHASTESNVYAVPSTVAGIREIWARHHVDYEDIHDCDSVWDTIAANVTGSADDEDKREGSASLKLVVAAGVSAGTVIASDTVSDDITGMTHLEFWVKSTVATAAGDLTLSMSGTGYSEETFTIPALTADTWTFVRVPITRAEEGSDVTAINLNYVTDIGACTIWLDGVQATREGSEIWVPFHPSFWRINKDSREIVFQSGGHPGYALMQLIGRKKPTLLNADATECDIEPEYIIAKATSLALRARMDRNADNRQAAQTEADRYEALAQQALSRQQTPSEVRWVSD